MGIIVKQDEARSELQQKIAADIAERQRAAAKGADVAMDGVDDQRIVEGTSHMSKTAMIIMIVLVVVAIGITVYATTR